MASHSASPLPLRTIYTPTRGFRGLGLLLLVAVWGYANTTFNDDKMVYKMRTNLSNQISNKIVHVPTGDDDPIHILITACGIKGVDEYYLAAIDLLKTIQRYGTWESNSDNGNDILSEKIIVHAFTDNVTKLTLFVQDPVTFRLVDHLDIRIYRMPTEPPKNSTGFNLFRKCASARLYALALFESVGYHRKEDVKKGSMTNDDLSNNSSLLQGQKIIPDRILYLDSDTLVTTHLRKLWDNATKQFDEQPAALFAMAQEKLTKDCVETGIYKDIPGANVTITKANGDVIVSYISPYPIGTCGYNSGVLFAHLKRWQEQDFSSMINEQVAVASKYNIKMPLGDQGILNAMAARFPERLMELSCVWNMRSDLIRKCSDAFRDNGGGIVHGNRHVFSKGDGMAVALRNYLVRDYEVWEEPFATIFLHDIVSNSGK